MSELSGNVEKFGSYLNLVFPSGALFLVCTQAELKILLLDLTTNLLQTNNEVTAARVVGRNLSANRDVVWVLSKSVTINSSGEHLQIDHSPVLWLERPHNGVNLLIKESLGCDVHTPFDSGESLISLCRAIQAFMSENFVPTLATMASSLMAASYEHVISSCGCIGIPILFGEPGSCKSEALKCRLALFGADKTHFFNSQTTVSYIFDALKSTTLPIGLDDISEKGQDVWEELVINAYNNTSRGTRSYNSEKFLSIPIMTANWTFSRERKRAHTRCIVLPFVQHCDEENSTTLYEVMSTSRRSVSRSVGCMVKICEEFVSPEGQTFRRDEIHPQISAIFNNCEPRFQTIMSTFAYFFLKVTQALILS